MCEPIRIGGSFGVAAVAPADDVAGGVDAHDEPRVLHELLDVLAARDVGVAERDAAHSAFGVGAELRQLGDVLLDAVGVDGWRPRLVRGERRRGQAQETEDREAEVAHGLTISVELS